MLAVAVIHNGSLKAVETGVVIVRLVNLPLEFQSSVRNGVSSRDIGAFGTAFGDGRV